MEKLIVKRIFRGNGSRQGTGMQTLWYANEKDLKAENVEVNQFINRNCKYKKYCYSKVDVKHIFGKDFELVFVDRKGK